MVTLAGRPTVLVVDDDKNMRDLVCRVLEVAGFEVLTAANGLKLLSILKVNRPDLILLDIMMSWVDGYELCRIIKKSADYRHIPVVFLSGRSDPRDVERGFSVGGDDYLTKPFDSGELVRRVRAQLARHTPHHAPSAEAPRATK